MPRRTSMLWRLFFSGSTGGDKPNYVGPDGLVSTNYRCGSSWTDACVHYLIFPCPGGTDAECARYGAKSKCFKDFDDQKQCFLSGTRMSPIKTTDGAFPSYRGADGRVSANKRCESPGIKHATAYYCAP